MRASPANAKPYIQHLRDVNAMATRTYRRLRGEVIRRSPSLAVFFDEFPNLKSCLIKEWQPWSTPSVPTECNEAIARHPGIHLIDQRMTYEEVPEDPQNPRGPIRRLPSGFPFLVRQVRTYLAHNVSWGGSNRSFTGFTDADSSPI